MNGNGLEPPTRGVNPYDYINEVSDPTLFAGRLDELSIIKEEIGRLAGDHTIAPMVAIVGERRVGKTSLSLRALELCEGYTVLAVRVSLTDMTAASPWEFWQEIFYSLLTAVRDRDEAGLPQLGFHPVPANGNKRFGLTEAQVEFFSAFGDRTATVPPNYLVYQGLSSICAAIIEADYRGILLIIDEAHLLVEHRIVTQQLRFAIREAGRCGILFVGEPELSQLFADSQQPLYAQGRVILLNNFVSSRDIAECALLPLQEIQRPLVSPMTVDYLVRLSQGKPNQIRLICHSIYNRYQKLEQDDLNITIDALDDVLENISATYSEHDVRQKVDTIRRLGSVDLESLYNMTRFPNWSIGDIVELDESFRAEGQSPAAVTRRENVLREKRDKFIRLGLMQDSSDQYVLAGDEFLYLYLRFWYEIRRYGELSRNLILGKGPPTPFGEKAQKLVRALVWGLRRPPAISMYSFNDNDSGDEDSIAKVKARFSALKDLLAVGLVSSAEVPTLLDESFRTCELVSNPGPHHLICLTVRSLENPRETIRIELYFDSGDIPLVLAMSTVASISNQAEHARILLEAWDSFGVELPSLEGLLDSIGAPRLEELMDQVGPLERWHLESVRHHIQGEGNTNADNDGGQSDHAEGESNEWLDMYDNGDVAGAEATLTKNLHNEKNRHKRARLYNDRGYVRYGLPELKMSASTDLQRALDLHFNHLPLSLLNLGVAHIDDARYEEAISNIGDALFLTFSAEDVAASYLRLRLPTGYRARRDTLEQHPGNVIEASYVNLAFALLKSSGEQHASDALQEGLALMPNSFRLKHALARMQLSINRVDLAESIYRDISQHAISDPMLANEISAVLRNAPRNKRGSRAKK